MKKTAQVVEVIDGDSFKIPRDEIRLENVDAPELGSANALKAKIKLENLIWKKIVEYEEQARDDYGRLVAQVWVDNINVNDVMDKFIANL